MKNLLLLVCLLSVYNACAQSKDTFEVYFAFNSPKISKESEDRIDRLIFRDTLIYGDKLIILGYADYVGGNGHNDTLSRQRAGRVRDYLVKYGFDKKDISLCIGKGKIDRKNVTGRDGYAADRKVQIIIDRTPAPKPIPPPPPKPAPAPPVVVKDIAKVKVNETYTMKNISFEPNEPVLLPQSLPDLEKLLKYLTDNPTVHIRIEGHICCMPPEQGTDTKYSGGFLSEFRAVAIFNYLVSNGIAKQRLTTMGLGNRQPLVYPEATEEDRINNRRVEIRIMKK